MRDGLYHLLLAGVWMLIATITVLWVVAVILHSETLGGIGGVLIFPMLACLVGAAARGRWN